MTTARAHSSGVVVTGYVWKDPEKQKKNCKNPGGVSVGLRFFINASVFLLFLGGVIFSGIVILGVLFQGCRVLTTDSSFCCLSK